MAALPKKPEPNDWLKAAADELKQGDRATLTLLQETYRAVTAELKKLPDTEGAAAGGLIQRAQMERVRKALIDEQAKLFDRLGDKVAARRVRSASRAAKLSAASEAVLLKLVGKGADGKKLYEGADITAQRTVETILARQGLSKVPLSERIYNTKSWMNGRLDRLIAATMANGLNAKRFAKVARDWFAPNVPGGTRYAAMRLARTEINNAFHATTLDYAQSKPWVDKMDWHLSKSHPTPDKCNEIAAESPYPVTEVPRKPHPQCMCYIVEAEVNEDDWIDRFVAGEFDQYLDQQLGKASGAIPATTPATATGRPVTVAPKPKAAPVVKANSVPTMDQKTYVPGAWSLQTDNEERIQQMMKDLAPLVPEDQRDGLRAMAEKFLKDTTEETDREYHNGPHVINFTGSLTEEQQKIFTGYVDQMLTLAPSDRNMHIVVAPTDKFEFGVGGETTLATGYMRINEKTLKQATWPGMPASADVSSALYVLAHEWGHSFPTKEDARDEHIHRESIKAGGMTRYGKSAPVESYAEAFAEWILTRGQTTNPAAQAYAKRFKWGERFGIH